MSTNFDYSPQYKVNFDRIVTPSFSTITGPIQEPKDEIDHAINALANFGEPVKAIDELKTWATDIRQSLIDNCIKDFMYDLDREIINRINNGY